jgi:hypothetical protein
VFSLGEKEPESKNRQLRLFQKHQRTNSFHERTGTEPVTRRAILFFQKIKISVLKTKVSRPKLGFLYKKFTLAR